MDCLQLVRKATIEGAQITHQEGCYVIFGTKFPEATKTIFKRTLKSDDYHYSLKDIIFFLENSALTVAEYRRKTVESRIVAVVEQDRHALQQYLSGKIDTCPQLDFEAAPSLEAENAQHAAKLVGKDQGAKSSKKESGKRKYAVLQEPSSVGVPSEDSLMLQSIRSDEYCLFNRLTVLNAVGTDFAIALKLFNDKILKPKDEEKAKPQQPSEVPTAVRGKSKSKTSMLTIIVPSALTSTITMYNAKEYFETGSIVGQQEQLPDKKKAKTELVLRSVSESMTVGYRVTDDPSKFSDEEWERVVAVFVTGQTWQFRGWKYDNPTDLFQRVLGVHLMYDDRQPPSTIQSWNCKILKVNQYKPHLNAGALREFWMMCDDFVKLKKPSLS